MRLVRLRVKEGNVVHHRPPSTVGPKHVGWRELQAGQIFSTDADEAERLERNGTATRARFWQR